MTTRRLLVAIGVFAGMLASPLVPAKAVPPPSFTTLQPGAAAKLNEKIPVQVVMLGYEEEAVPREWFEQYLPNVARPIDRQRTYRNIQRNLPPEVTFDDPRIPAQLDEMGLHYTFDHNLVYTDTSYEDSFFNYLLSIGVDERTITGYDDSLAQYLYNLQPGRKLDVTNNLVIDADAVERWLVEHPAPGIDPNRNTVVLVNWWGRDDFRFHDYQPRGEATSESGVNMPNTYWRGRLIAFGGTSAKDDAGFGRASRTWFHDLSAGPDLRTGNWVIDDTLGGFGPDPSWQNFFPPVWEYALGGAQDRWMLPDALGVITRFVAVNLLFAASPLYGHDSDAQMTRDVELDVTVHGNVAVTPSLLADRLGDLLGATPELDITRRPGSGPASQCHERFLADERCRPETDPAIYPTDANFFVGAERERAQWQDGSATYEAPAFVYEARAVRKWIGMADDNWTDGTRTEVNSMLGPSTFALGYGTSSTLIHEYGHHFGVSHPHDGYETEWGPNGYSANDNSSGIFYFAWVGDEVNSVMSYLDLNNDFSQFDIDNYQRWQAARYLRAANTIAGTVLASSRANAAATDLAKADASFAAAQVALHAHDYPAVEARAAEGYAHVRSAARAAKVTVATADRWAMAKPGAWRGASPKNIVAPNSEPADEMSGGKPVPAELMARFELGRNDER